jgi:phage recombination protein Bet
VHIVPMWSSAVENENGEKGGYIETIWPSIAELRTTAFRTGSYAGCDQAEFGPIVERTFTGKVSTYKNRQRVWETKEITVKFPDWCRITLYRMLHGHRCAFVGPKVKWLEAYATIGKTNLPNDMWENRSEGQLEKCAEGAALRRAFPEELGNEYAAEEMEGRRLRDVGDVIEHAPKQVSPSLAPPDPDGDGTTSKPAAASQAAATAAPDPSGHVAGSGDGVPLLTKQDLIDSIDKLESKLGALQWTQNAKVYLSLDALDGADRREVENKFTAVEAKLPA